MFETLPDREESMSDEDIDDDEDVIQLMEELSQEHFEKLTLDQSFVEDTESLPFSVTSDEILSTLYEGHDMTLTPLMKDVRCVIAWCFQYKAAVDTYLRYVWNTGAQMWETSCSGWQTEPTETKSQTAFTAKWRQLSGSAAFLKCVHVLYHTCSPSQAQRKVARAIAEKIKALIVHTVSNTLRSARPIQSEAVTDITSAGEANIRKLGGRALVKNRKLHINRAHNAVKVGHVDDMSDLAISILKSMEISYSVLVDVTSKPDSLRAVERSQGGTRGLTHITDQAFQFFLL